MTSGKMNRYYLKARQEWIEKGLKVREEDVTKEQDSSFQQGFYKAWKTILTDEKLYRTFNVRWEKVKIDPTDAIQRLLENVTIFILKDNDERVLATMIYGESATRRFKYFLRIRSELLGVDYYQFVDETDIRRLKEYHKAKIINDYTIKVECEIKEQKERMKRDMESIYQYED